MFHRLPLCPILLGLEETWQKWLGSWTRWWNTHIKVNPTQVSEQMDNPVERIYPSVACNATFDTLMTHEEWEEEKISNLVAVHWVYLLSKG